MQRKYENISYQEPFLGRPALLFRLTRYGLSRPVHAVMRSDLHVIYALGNCNPGE